LNIKASRNQTGKRKTSWPFTSMDKEGAELRVTKKELQLMLSEGLKHGTSGL